MNLKHFSATLLSLLLVFQVFIIACSVNLNFHQLRDLIDLNKTAYYTIEYDPILNITRLSYTSILEIDNNGQEDVSVEIIDFALDINSSTIQLLPGTPSYYLLETIGPITMIGWKLSISPGTTYLKYSADALSSPLLVREKIMVNGSNAELAQFMGITYVVAGIGSEIVWNITLSNNLQRIGASQIIRPPIYCTLSFKIDTRYLEVLEVLPESNSSSASGDYIQYNWNLLFENESNIIVSAKVINTSVWGTVPIESITIQAAACPEDIFNILESQLSSLSSMISAVNTSYTLYKNLGDGLLNMSKNLEMMVTGANKSSEALYVIGSEMISQGRSASYYISSLKEIEPLLKRAYWEISMVNASGVLRELNQTLNLLHDDIQNTIDQLESVAQLLLNVNNTLTELLNQTLDLDQRQLILDAVEGIDQAYYTIISIIETLESTLQLIKMLQESVVFLEPQIIETQNAILKAIGVMLETLIYIETIPSTMIEVGNIIIEIAEGNAEMSKGLAYAVNASSHMANMTLNAASELESKLNDLTRTYNELEAQYNALKTYKSMLNSMSPSINPIKLRPSILSLSPFKLNLNYTENVRLIIVEGATIINATNLEAQLIYSDAGHILILAPKIVNQTVYSFYNKEIHLTKSSLEVKARLIASEITDYQVYSFIAVYQPTLAKEFKAINVTLPTPSPPTAEIPYIPYVEGVLLIIVIIIAVVVIFRKIRLK